MCWHGPTGWVFDSRRLRYRRAGMTTCLDSRSVRWQNISELAAAGVLGQDAAIFRCNVRNSREICVTTTASESSFGSAPGRAEGSKRFENKAAREN